MKESSRVREEKRESRDLHSCAKESVCSIDRKSKTGQQTEKCQLVWIQVLPALPPAVQETAVGSSLTPPLCSSLCLLLHHLYNGAALLPSWIHDPQAVINQLLLFNQIP